MIRNGQPGMELATKWGLSQRMVEKILARLGEDKGKLLNLFEGFKS